MVNIHVPKSKKEFGVRGAISNHLHIIQIDLTNGNKESIIPVVSSINGVITTEDDVSQQVSFLNRNCGLHGGTAQPHKRKIAFRLGKSN